MSTVVSLKKVLLFLKSEPNKKHSISGIRTGCNLHHTSVRECVYFLESLGLATVDKIGILIASQATEKLVGLQLK